MTLPTLEAEAQSPAVELISLKIAEVQELLEEIKILATQAFGVNDGADAEH